MPTSLSATAISPTQINLAWTLADSSDTSVELFLSTNGSSFAPLTTLGAGATSYNNTGLSGSTTYYYYVEAINGVGPSGNSNTASTKTPAAPTVPGSPTSLTATAASPTQINLAWTLADSTDTSVQLFRSTNDSTFTALTTLGAGATTYSDTGLSGSTTYYYYVEAINAVGPSGNSNTASAKTPAAPTVPGAPTSLTATAASTSQINLAWTLADSTDTSVELFRSTNASTFTALTTLGAGATSYSDTGLTASTTYSYYVEAINAVGPSGNSNTASAATQAPTGTTAVYLSSLPFVGTPTNGWGPVMRNVTVGAGNGNPANSNPLTIKGVVYPHGLGTHAYSSVTFALNGQYSTFNSYIGIDDEVGGAPGEVYFQVWGDGVELYGSPLVTVSTPTVSVNVGVAGVQQLTLIVNQGGSTNAFDHSDWAEARVVPNGVPVPTAPAAPTKLCRHRDFAQPDQSQLDFGGQHGYQRADLSLDQQYELHGLDDPGRRRDFLQRHRRVEFHDVLLLRGRNQCRGALGQFQYGIDQDTGRSHRARRQPTWPPPPLLPRRSTSPGPWLTPLTPAWKSIVPLTIRPSRR